MFFWTFIILANIIKIITSQSCMDNSKNCLKCNPLTNLCAICSDPDFYAIDENGGCSYTKKCIPGVNYCNECDMENNLCKICDDKYHADENGGCTMAENCKISYKGICLECKENFVLIGGKNIKICKSIFSTDFSNCEKISTESGICMTCKEGYYLSPGDHKCIKVENCNESIFGNCILCNSGFYYDKLKNECKKKEGNLSFCRQTLDGETCDTCDKGKYFDEEGLCTFANFCSKSSRGYCEKCKKGYYMAKNKFCSLTDNCKITDIDIGICSECEEGFYLDKKDYQCKSNKEDEQFKYCKRAFDDSCIQCESGYYLTKEKKCSTTIYCEESENGICKLCIDNYYLDLNNICIDVEHCIYSKNGECIQCEDKYFYNKLGRNCTLISEKFENCKMSNDGTACSLCHSDFYLRMNDSLCEDNTEEGTFYKCKISNYKGERCEICLDGYTIGNIDKKCSLIEHCAASENANKCIKCDDYYCLDVKKGICIDNRFITNETDTKYYACNKTDEEGNKCIECLKGFEVGNKGNCVNLEDCEEISDDGICLKCKNNTEVGGVKYCANDVFGCIEFFDRFCVNCNNIFNLKSCTKCKEGYMISNPGYCVFNYSNWPFDNGLNDKY